MGEEALGSYWFNSIEHCCIYYDISDFLKNIVTPTLDSARTCADIDRMCVNEYDYFSMEDCINSPDCLMIGDIR